MVVCAYLVVDIYDGIVASARHSVVSVSEALLENLNGGTPDRSPVGLGAFVRLVCMEFEFVVRRQQFPSRQATTSTSMAGPP